MAAQRIPRMQVLCPLNIRGKLMQYSPAVPLTCMPLAASGPLAWPEDRAHGRRYGSDPCRPAVFLHVGPQFQPVQDGLLCFVSPFSIRILASCQLLLKVIRLILGPMMAAAWEICIKRYCDTNALPAPFHHFSGAGAVLCFLHWAFLSL